MHACMLRLLQLCPALCNPMDCSLPGSSVHGILQAGILEWVVMPSSRGSSRSKGCLFCLLCWQVGSLPLAPPGKPMFFPDPPHTKHLVFFLMGIFRVTSSGKMGLQILSSLGVYNLVMNIVLYFFWLKYPVTVE